MKIIIILMLLVWPLASLAHGDTTAQSQIVGDNKIELEYSTVGEIKANEYTGYFVHLFNNDTGQQLSFDSAFIRITDGNLPVLSGKAAFDGQLEEGTATIGGTLPKAGEYQAQVTIFKDGKALPTANFKFNVGSGGEIPKVNKDLGIKKDALYLYIGIFIAGVVLGILFKPLFGSRM
ncbi:MAG: hypothetical protein KW788_02540 [Candidatus Doudnabacteria bacterium]|nr:hypothetical protein [Candidatus Doudnabacteria bacterium]